MSVPLRVALAEDEPLNRKRLERLLKECGCEVVGSFANGKDLLQWIAEGGRPQALFLDIRMPEMDGLELAEELPPDVPVVFVTAHADHAVEAFASDAVDYLMKPVTGEDLARSLARLQRRLAPANPGLPAPRRPGRIPLEAGGGVVFLELAKATHFDVEDEVVYAHAGERLRTVWRSLGEVEAAFPEAGLLRIQRHLLLRPDAVLGLRSLGGGRLAVRVTGGAELEASRGASPMLKARLGLAGKDVERG
jgi:two-component system LytT family response regulator/two-component system response regulator AlgR